MVVPLLAQAASSTVVGSTPPTTFADPNQIRTSTSGQVVFFAVVLIIAVGALVLYLRHRTPRSPGD